MSNDSPSGRRRFLRRWVPPRPVPPPRIGGAASERDLAACHGANGEGKPADALVGGQGTLKDATRGKDPVRSIGSFGPYATTVFDFIRLVPRNLALQGGE